MGDRKREENEAVGMSCCGLLVGGWVGWVWVGGLGLGGWVGGRAALP